MAASSILVVDDDQDTCSSLSDVLSDLGYAVDVAHGGAAALQLSRARPYRLALLDYQMPGMTGVELYRRLREYGAETVAVLVTAFASDGTARAAAEAGIREVVAKPVDFGRLLRLVQEAVGTR